MDNIFKVWAQSGCLASCCSGTIASLVWGSLSWWELDQNKLCWRCSILSGLFLFTSLSTRQSIVFTSLSLRCLYWISVVKVIDRDVFNRLANNTYKMNVYQLDRNNMLVNKNSQEIEACRCRRSFQTDSTRHIPYPFGVL
jgi:hypothetical protein